jgi:hypothetical protein
VAPFYAELGLSTQTAYAQLFDAALGAEHARTVADLTGSFNAKTVKGRKYWYFQYTEPAGKLRQIYVGPDGDPVHRLMAQKASRGASAALVPLSRSALALGCAGLLPRHYRVIRRLADYGFFQAGGALIGTHAFLAYGNMLGIRWGSQERTQDIDFADAGKAIALVLPSNVEVDTHDAIASLGMGFLPLSGLGGKTGGSYLIPSEPGFRLDFLTPRHRGGATPFSHPQLKVTLQPLPFMEFSLEGIGQGVVFCAEGAVVVNVPEPARFALHKLVVFGELGAALRAKANKDLSQAAHVLAFLAEHHRDSLERALRDMLARGRGWRTRLATGAAALARAYPGLAVAGSLDAAATADRAADHGVARSKTARLST